MGLEAGTFSIVAADPTTAEVGCAVQSKYFAIGAVTPWVRAGVRAAATQAMGVVARNGERVLDALARNVDPAVALDQALADDADRELGSRRLRLSSSSSAQQRAPEKASIAHAIYASMTIPNRSSNCAACSPSGGNGKPNATFELIPLACASVPECTLSRVSEEAARAASSALAMVDTAERLLDRDLEASDYAGVAASRE